MFVIDNNQLNDVLFLNAEHLSTQSKGKDIEDIWYRDFNSYQLPLQAFLNARVVVYQSPQQEIKILKSGASINGALLNQRLLEKEGWVANQELGRYEKEDEDFYLTQGRTYGLHHPITNQALLQIQAVDVYDKIDNQLMCTVSTLEELKDVFEEDEFLYSEEEEERIPQIAEFTLD